MKNYSWAIVLSLAVCVPFLLSFDHSHADKANAFLNSLTNQQRGDAHMDFEHMSRVVWTYIPGSIISHSGIALRELDENQKKLVHEMLMAYLSDKGYAKVSGIMTLEQLLSDMDDDNPMRDVDQYVVGIYGDPDDKGVWGWCFQGHHISLNFTIVKDKISMSPRFFGASPAEVKSGPQKGLRVLHAEEDLGLELINLLHKEQQRKAIFSKHAYLEIVTTNATEVGPLELVGISYSELSEEQKLVLKRIIVEYLNAMPTELAATRLGHIEEDGLSKVHFGWAGGTNRHKAHYYRVQGPSFLIEFDNTQNGANHIHSVWRDFSGDFGRDLLHDHYKSKHVKR